MKSKHWKFLRITLLSLLIVILLTMGFWSKRYTSQSNTYSSLLSDPFLQLPTSNSVRVVWFTSWEGDFHNVIYGQRLNNSVKATTTKLSLVREDSDSRLDIDYQKVTSRDIWRHEATISELKPNKRIPYQVVSIHDGEEILSRVFTLAAAPQPNTPLKILLTSDHQLMPMAAANMQKVVETVGKVDAVFIAGDLVNIPDRASEWFDDNRGGAFFPVLQGRAKYKLDKSGIERIYHGGEIIQHAVIFPAIGNHEVMGRFSDTSPLKRQFTDAVPRAQAEKLYWQDRGNINETGDPKIQKAWLKANSFNTDTYEEIFTLPENSSGGKKYYAVTFGNIRLVVLYVTNIWRSPSLESNVKGRYQEKTEDLNQPEKWGYGQHIFEPIVKGSSQYHWLEQELQSEAFKQAKYKIVMFHHPPHTLGGNIVPPYTDPLARIEYDENKQITSVRYEYPQENDYIIRDVLPLLESAEVQLVYYGHSHLWNRFVNPQGVHFLESSNVGNTYGAHIEENKRPVPKDNPQLNYVETGDPNGLTPIIPTIRPLKDNSGKFLPYIASNDITVFSIFDTAMGTVSSYFYDTRKPESPVVKFDEFMLIPNN
ncbi:MAG: metallophosphoesterase [Xenococcaceae cyanobacterium MO_188.B29]|nr:metallophosphoesterase [Xenococcaceae cyanobacterium MO_188.B29]